MAECDQRSWVSSLFSFLQKRISQTRNMLKLLPESATTHSLHDEERLNVSGMEKTVMLYLHMNRWTDKWSSIESPGNCRHAQQTYGKAGKMTLLINRAGQWKSECQSTYLKPLPHTRYEHQFQKGYRPNQEKENYVAPRRTRRASSWPWSL